MLCLLLRSPFCLNFIYNNFQIGIHLISLELFFLKGGFLSEWQRAKLWPLNVVVSRAMQRRSLPRRLPKIIISKSIFHFFSDAFFLYQDILLNKFFYSLTIEISHRSFHSFSLHLLQVAAPSHRFWSYSVESSGWRSKQHPFFLFIPVIPIDFKQLIDVILRGLILEDVNVFVLCFVYLIKILHIILFHLQFLLRRTE